jgi:hypothetical protein
MPCTCATSVRTSDCPVCRPTLLDPQMMTYILMAEDLFIGTGRPLPPREMLLEVFQVARKVVTEDIG